MKKVYLVGAFVMLFALAGCTKPVENTVVEATTYNQDSRKTIIPQTCKAFSDGCNDCNRTEDDTNLACTAMYCEKYEEPKCLDPINPSGNMENTAYNEDSRKTMIPETCKAFFDGCNTCNRTEDGTDAACTKMYCQTYEAPKCLD